MTQILLIRHGQTLWNAERRLQGQKDAPLSEKGLQQAETLAQRLSQAHFDAFYTSDLGRAVHTSEIINAHHNQPLQARTGLREVNLGVWEGKTVPQLEQGETESDLLAKWRQDSVANRPPGGERLEELQSRVVGALEEIVKAYPEGQVAVVTHGGVVKAAVTWVLGLPLGNQRQFEVSNCSITRLDLSPQRSILVGLNDISHYEDESKKEEAPAGVLLSNDEP